MRPSSELHKLVVDLLTLSNMNNRFELPIDINEWPEDYDFATLNQEVEILVVSKADYENFIEGEEQEVEEVIERLGIWDLDEFALEVVEESPIQFTKLTSEAA